MDSSTSDDPTTPDGARDTAPDERARDPKLDLDAFESALTAALGAAQEQETELTLNSEEQILETVRRLEAGDAADDSDLRQVLAEVSDAVAVAEAAGAGAEGTDGIRPNVRVAAIEAYAGAGPEAHVAEAPVVGGPGAELGKSPSRVPTRAVRTEPLRALRLRRSSRVPLQAAALLLIGLGVALWVGVSGSPDAVAGIHLGALHRVDLARGRPEVSSGRWLLADERIAAGPDEIVGLRLQDGSTVALEGPGALAVSTVDGAHPILGLLSGQACLTGGPSGTALALPDGTRFVVDRGSGWLGRSPETAPGSAALAAGARGRLVRPDKTVVELVGPVRVSLADASTPPVEPEPELFRSLAWFRPTPKANHPGRLVDAGRWRVLAGRARRAAHRLRVEPRGETRSACVAWRPAPSVRAARVLEVVLRAPVGTRIAVPALGLTGEVGEAPVSAAPGRRSIALGLPNDWYVRLDEGGREIEIEILWPDGHDDAVLFEGTTFLFGSAGEQTTRGGS